jgi:hypothetical protein
LKPEQRKSIINLLRGEDAGYRDSSYGIRKSLIFQLYIYIGKSKLAYMLFRLIALMPAQAGIEYFYTLNNRGSGAF